VQRVTREPPSPVDVGGCDSPRAVRAGTPGVPGDEPGAGSGPHRAVSRRQHHVARDAAHHAGGAARRRATSGDSSPTLPRTGEGAAAREAGVQPATANTRARHATAGTPRVSTAPHRSAQGSLEPALSVPAEAPTARPGARTPTRRPRLCRGGGRKRFGASPSWTAGVRIIVRDRRARPAICDSPPRQRAETTTGSVRRRLGSRAAGTPPAVPAPRRRPARS